LLGPVSPLVLAASWYDVSQLATLWTKLAEVWGPDRARVEREFRAMGRFVAEDNLTTVYRMIFSVLRPDNFVQRLPTLWHTYFAGLTVESREQGRGRAATTVSGLGGLPYIACVAAGWQEYCFEKVGATSIQVTEAAWEAGRNQADPLRFAISWRSER
jgi:hypothetical protein